MLDHEILDVGVVLQFRFLQCKYVFFPAFAIDMSRSINKRLPASHSTTPHA